MTRRVPDLGGRCSPGPGTTAFTGLKKVSVRALRALVKNTPHEFVFDHPDDNETVRLPSPVARASR